MKPFILAGLLLAGAGLNTASQADDLAPLCDEFDNAASLANWQRIFQTEGWNANQLQTFDINTSQAGWMRMVPHASTWYQDYRGELTYKNLTGDFVITTSVHHTNRAGNAAPSSIYSLGGIMVRTPRNITPLTWAPGGENYVFLSLGAAETANSYQFEVKTTINSVSNLITEPAPANEAQIQVARIGSSLIMLRRVAGGNWVVHRRYSRPDFPAQLQAGLTVYTDWPTASALAPFDHNSTVIAGGNPDLDARFDYVRFRRPIVPPALAGQNFADPSAVSDADLLTFLGDNADDAQLPKPSLRVNNAATKYEGSVAAPGSTTFNVVLSAPSTETVTVKFNTTNGVVNPALAGADFVAQSGTLTFLPGQVSKNVLVNFVGDAVAEMNETFFLDIKTPTNATIADSRGSAYIRNDDGPQIFIDNAKTIDEGPASGAPAGTRPQTFVVRLSAASTDVVTVDWATAHGTAGPADYVAASGKLTFAPGEMTKIITVLVNGDTTVEPTETYRVNLSNQTFAVIADSQGVAYIRNDDVSAITSDEPSE